jgi:hydrogenase expression/formation protein HypC
MCLGIVAHVMSTSGHAVVARTSDGRSLAATLLTVDEPVAVGQWVVIHSGFVLHTLTDDEARAALAIRSAEETP